MTIKTKTKSMTKKYQDILIYAAILLFGGFVLTFLVNSKDFRPSYNFIFRYQIQTIKIKNNDIIPIRISRNDSNQIVISGGDKIKSIKNDRNQLEVLKSNSRCNDHFNKVFLHYKNDADQNIYCVSFLKQDEPTTILITTEKDVTYRLLLVPASVRSKLITIAKDNSSDETEFRVY